MTGYEPHDLLGNLGVFFILITYLLLQMEKIQANSVVYCSLNALGAGLVLFSLTFAFNLSAFIVESAWLAISLYGLGRLLFRSKSITDEY